MKSKAFLKILGLVILLIKTLGSEAARYCPNYCKCDLYEGRNRADCSGKRLINPYVDLSAAVELLDLSYNDIAIIDDDCFEHYRYVINLTIAHNDVHTIYLDAFLKLRRLSVVDLSYNRLEDIDERLFEANHHLWRLNLEGNKFMTLRSRPLLRSTSLRALNLRNAAINYIGNEVFTALPQLAELNLSQNMLITLNAASFNADKHLKTLLLDENPWICDKSMVKALSIMRHRGVNVSTPECDAAYHEWQKQLPLRVEGNNKGNNNSNNNSSSSTNSAGTRMFERMQLSPVAAAASSGTNMSNSSAMGYEKTSESPKTLNWRNLSAENENEDADDEAGGSYGNGEASKNNLKNVAVGEGDVAGDDGNGDDDDDDILDIFASYISNKPASRTRLRLPGIEVDEKLCDGTRENLCRRYRNCLEQVSHVLIKQLDNNSAKDTKYTETEMYLAFMFGNVVGISVVVFLLTCILFVKNLCNRCKKLTKATDVLEDIYETLPYATHVTPVVPIQTTQCVPPAPPTAPFPTRRTRRPRRQPVRIPIEHAVVRRDYEQDSGSFISRLLGRPARRQYYRATATLIRSLSRTSLFNGNSQRDQNNTHRTPESGVTTPTAETHPLNQQQQQRPETPPPNYGDIISKK